MSEKTILIYCPFNLRSCHLRLTLGRATLCSLILASVSQHRWLNAIGQKKAPPSFIGHWLSLEIHIIGTERRAEVRPTGLIFEHYEP
jgi:hypothetical protein